MRAASPSAAPAQPIVINIIAEEGAALEPRLQSIAGNASVQVHRALQPQTVQMATAATIREITKPRL